MKSRKTILGNDVQNHIELLTTIYNLEIGKVMLIECDLRNANLIRSGIWDPVRIAYRGKGAYKTRFFCGKLFIERLR